MILCEYNKKFLLLETYRYGINDFSLELPRGYRNANESLKECAIRELKEETNIEFNTTIDTIQKLGEIAVNSAIIASKVTLFLIIITQPIDNLELQAEEQINSYSWTDITTLNKYISEGKIIDSFTINTLMFYNLKNNFI